VIGNHVPGRILRVHQTSLQDMILTNHSLLGAFRSLYAVGAPYIGHPSFLAVFGQYLIVQVVSNDDQTMVRVERWQLQPSGTLQRVTIKTF
jgi:hypothetical protein